MDTAHIIIDLLEKHGFRAYYVGGFVRDMLLELPCADVDIVTDAVPEEIERIFGAGDGIGKKFGTVTVHAGDITAEVTTMRREDGYTDKRHPDSVKFTSDIYGDLVRRDFTVNAIAWHPTEGFIDPYRGRDDIARKRLKTVGDPRRRFFEDPLRILRGWRFCAELGFSMEKETAEAAKELAGLTAVLPCGAVRREVDKILRSDSPQILLEMLGGRPGAKKMSAAAVSAAAVIMSGLEPETVEVRYAVSPKKISEMKDIIAIMHSGIETEKDLKMQLYIYGLEKVSAAIEAGKYLYGSNRASQALSRLLESGEAYNKSMLNIDHAAFAAKYGKRTGEILDKLTRAAISGEIPNERRSLEKLADKLSDM